MVAISATCWIWPTESTVQFLVRNPTTVDLTLFISPNFLKSLCLEETVTVCVLIVMAVLGWKNWGPANSEIECKDCCLLLSHVWLFCDLMDCSPPSPHCSWDFSGKNTGMGCHFLHQGIFPTQGLNLHLLLGRQILYHWATGKPWM